MILWAGETRGPRAVPGAYQVKLTVDGQTFTETFAVRKDPRVATGPAEFARQFELLTKIRDKLTETHNAIIRLREARGQVNDLLKRVGEAGEMKPVVEAGKSLSAN